MKYLLIAMAVTGPLVLMSSEAGAYCGVIQKHGMGATVGIAQNHANMQMNKAVQKLKVQYPVKLQLDARQVSCLGGAVAIGTNGKKIEGDPSCTVTQPFCINP
jgi:hypothetical protein